MMAPKFLIPCATEETFGFPRDNRPEAKDLRHLPIPSITKPLISLRISPNLVLLFGALM
jgi:hypothetical protein